MKKSNASRTLLLLTSGLLICCSAFTQGNVGIGVMSPQARLHILGGNDNVTTEHGDLAIGTDQYGLRFGIDTSGVDAGDTWMFTHGGLERFIFGNGFNIRYLIDSSGNMGFGTTSPINRFDIRDSGIVDSTTVVLGLVSDVSNRPALLFSEFATATPGSGMMIEYDGRLPGISNKLYFRGVDGLEKFTFTSGGRLGIGTTNPLAPFHAFGDGVPIIRLTQDNSNFNIIRMENTTSPGHFWDIRSNIDSEPGNSRMILFSSQQGNLITILGNGNVGISAYSPHEMLEIGYTGRVFIGNGGGDNRKGLLIDGNEPGDYVTLYPYDYYMGHDLNVHIATPVTIGAGNPEPDSSVAFQVQSTERGILIPRMTQVQRESIDTPEESLLVYQTDYTSGYWFFADGQWRRINESTILSDTDNDTRIQVEKNPDEDKIRFDLGNLERWIMTGPRLEPRNTGSSIMIGKDAGLNSSLNFKNNVFVGDSAGIAYTTGGLCVAIGHQSLGSAQTTHHAVAVGYQALKNNGLGGGSTANANSALGSMALWSNTTGYNNTACGYASAHSLISGSNNTTVGAIAMQSNMNGSYNTAVGSHAHAFGEAGNYNTAAGFYALRLNEGNQNTGVGIHALESNISGAWNCALGAHADVGASDLIYATAIGASAVVNQSNSIVLGDPDRTIKVGIGTSTPTDLLTITGSDPRFFIGDTTSSARRGLLIDGVESGDYVRIHGYDYANGNLDINIPSNLLVGVWGGTTSYTLELAGTVGTAAKPGGGTWTSTSDRRLKQDIRDYTDGLDALMQIRPVQYRYTEATGYDTAKAFVGVIAQELQEITPYMVSTFQKDGEAYLAVDASAMTYLLINAVQEQQEIIAEQQEIFARQQAIMAEQQAAIDELRNLVGLMYVSESGVHASIEK